MKRLLLSVLAVMLIVTTSLSATGVSIVEGNIDGLKYIDAYGRQADELPLDFSDDGGVLITENEGISVSNDSGTITLQPDTFAVFMEDDENSNKVVYLVHGQLNVLKKDNTSPLTIYTPTSKGKITDSGEVVVVSTEDEEKYYNFSSGNIEAYDSVLDRSYDLKPMNMADLLKIEKPSKVTPSQYYDLSQDGSLPLFDSEDEPQLAPTEEPDSRALTPTDNENLPDQPNESETTPEDASEAEPLNAEEAAVPPVEENPIEELLEEPIKEAAEELAEEAIEEAAKPAIPNAPTFAEPEARLEEPISEGEPNNEEEATNQEEGVEPLAEEEGPAVPAAPTLLEPESTLNELAPEEIAEGESPEEQTEPEEAAEEQTEPEEEGENVPEPTPFNEPERALEIVNRVPATPELISALRALEVPTDTFIIKVEKDDSIEPKAKKTKASKDSTEVKSEVSSEQPAKKATITDSGKKNTFSFDLSLATRTYLNNQNERSLSIALVPNFKYGTFNLALNLDPFLILSYKDRASVLDWVGYGFSFINTLRFRSINESFYINLDKTTNLAADNSQIYAGSNHIWDKYSVPLSLNTTFKSTYLGLKAFAEDLTFDENYSTKGIYGADIDIRLSRNYPFQITLSALSIMPYSNPKETSFIPEVSIYIPFLYSTNNTFGLKAAAATRLDLSDAKLDLAKSGSYIGFSAPLKLSSFYLTPGFYYSNAGTAPNENAPLHFYGIGKFGYTPVINAEDKLITLALNTGLTSKYVDLDITAAGDLLVDTMKFYQANTLLDASIALKLDKIALRGGLTVQNFTELNSYAENGKYYAGLDFKVSGIESYIRAGVESFNNKTFFVTYGAAASFLGTSKDKKNVTYSIPISFEAITGYNYRFAEERSNFLVMPVLTFGKDNLLASFRAPLAFSFDNSEFVLETWNGKKWWNFGGGESGNLKIYDAVTDAFALIEQIKLGSADSSLAYIDMSRDFYQTDTLFTTFGSSEDLSLRTGLNFYNFKIGLYADDLEAPHIGEISLGIYPVGPKGLSLSLKLINEAYFKTLKDFNLFVYPEARLDIPFFKGHLNLAAFAIGSVETEYKNGESLSDKTHVIYDFENKRFYSAMAGGELSITYPTFSLAIQGGYRTGALTPDMYNIFTSSYNLLPSLMNQDLEEGWYGKAVTGFSFKHFNINLAYSVTDINKLIKDFKSVDNDLLTLTGRIQLNDCISLNASLSRLGVASLFNGETTLDSFFNSSSSLYSIGLGFDYGIVKMEAFYHNTFLKSGYQASEYINIGDKYISDKTTPCFSVLMRISLNGKN